MAGMKRFVTYIYSYEDKRKGSNTGFAKIEIRGEDCRVELHLRGIYVGQTVLTVYLFREDAGDIVGVRIGEMKLVKGGGDCAIVFKASRIADTPFGVNDLEGIFLISADDRIFMSRWKEGAPLVVCRERFRQWEPEKNTLEVSGESNPVLTEKEQQGTPGTGQPVPKTEMPRTRQHTNYSIVGNQTGRGSEKPVPQDMPAAMAAESTVSGAQHTAAMPAAMAESTDAEPPVPASGETIQATELPMRNVFPGGDWTVAWQVLRNGHSLCRPFADREACCVQIELKELRELPRRYWYLGNNSFLLHGFFNYRYLVVGKTAQERWFIGVPGIYQRQERVMAAIFGFPEFIPVAQNESGESENETGGEPVNRFGCWFRYIEE